MPPTSSASTRGASACRATKAAPIVPAAVPESSIWMHWLLPSSAVITPPFDFVIIGSAPTPALRSEAWSEAM